MIRGGAEYSLGIYITGVDRGSAAENAGLQVGDQILEVNGESFLAVTHDTAVSLLKYSRHLEMSIRRIAKVPHSCTTYHRRRSTKTRKRASSEEEVNSSLGAILTMIEEKSKSVLSFTEHSLLHGTVTEYAAGRVPVSKILIVAEKVLNSPDKLSLLTELREVVRLADLNEFDATVFNRSSSLSIEKSRFLNEDLSSPGEIDSINKLVHCLQLNTGEILTNSDENHFEDLPKCLDKNVKNREENKKRKGVTRQKERKRYKKLPKNDNSMKNNSILAGDDLALLRNSSVKLKSSMNTRKFLKKRLSEKSLIRKEDIDANEQETLPSRRRHSLSGDENRFRYLSDTQLPQMFSDHLQEHLSLPQFSDSDLPGVVTSQPSYFSRHSLSDAAIHQTSYNHHHSHRSLTPNGKLSHLTSFSPLHLKGLSSSPIFSPTFLESDGSSPQFSQVNHSSKFQLSLFSQDIPENGLLHSDHFSGHLPRIPPSYLSFEQRGKYSPDPFSEDQSDIVHSHLEPYYMTRHLIDDRNDCNEPQFYPSRVQQEFRHVYTSASIRDPNEMSVHQAQRRFKNAAAQTGEIIEFDEIFDSGIVDNHRRSKDMQFLMKDSYTRDIYHNHFPFWDQNFDNLERSQLSYQLSKSRQVSESSENSCYLPRRFPPHHMLSHSRRRAPPLVDGHGRFHVKVRKTKASLGIAIEGGSNTKHPLPRVINISTDGAAFEAANLRVGQLILESNGKKLSGKTHEEVARIIAECWTDKSKRELDLLVNDKGQTDTDIRSSHTRLSKAP